MFLCRYFYSDIIPNPEITNNLRIIFIGVINLGRVAQSLVVANHCLTTGQPDVTKADHYYKGGIV